MHEFGNTREQLAEVAVAAREWALLNPVAWEKKPLTIADVLAARPISYPFTVRDCCLITDGGGAIVMMSADDARSLGKPPRLGIAHEPLTPLLLPSRTGTYFAPEIDKCRAPDKSNGWHALRPPHVLRESLTASANHDAI